MSVGSTMRPFVRTLVLVLSITGLASTACTNEASTEPGDPPADAGTPSALGNGLRNAEINNPASPQAAINNQMGVAVTGSSFIVEDRYDETPGSVGAIYVQDFHSSARDAGGLPPWSGMLLYKATFEPASLAVAPGDIVDFTGEYQHYVQSVFPAGQFQIEMYEPIVTFRFDYSPPAPTVINVSDLEGFATGNQWMSMLVTVEGLTGGGTNPDGTGRGGVFLTADTGASGVTMDNELFALDYTNPKYATPGKTHFTSVTGIVTYFISFHIAPRSQADIQAELVE